MTSSKRSEYYNVASILPKFKKDKDNYLPSEDLSTLKKILHTWYIYKCEVSNIILTNKLQILMNDLFTNHLSKQADIRDSSDLQGLAKNADLFYPKRYNEIIYHVNELRKGIEINYAKIDEAYKVIIELESCFSGDVGFNKLDNWFKKFTNLMIYDYKYNILKIDKDILSEELAFLKFSEDDNDAWDYSLLLFETSNYDKFMLDLLPKMGNCDKETLYSAAFREKQLFSQLQDLLCTYWDKECEYTNSVIKDMDQTNIAHIDLFEGHIDYTSKVAGEVYCRRVVSYRKKMFGFLQKILTFNSFQTQDIGLGKIHVEDKFRTLLKFGYTALTSNKCYEMNLLINNEMFDKKILHEKLFFDLLYLNNCPCCKFFNLLAPVEIDKPYDYTHISRRVNLNISGLSDASFFFLDNTNVIGASSVVVERNSYLKLSSIMKEMFNIEGGYFIIPDKVNHIPASRNPISLSYFINRNSTLKELWKALDPSNNEADMFLSLPYDPEKSIEGANLVKPTFEDSCGYVKHMITLFVKQKITLVDPADDYDLQKSKLKHSFNKKEYLQLADIIFTSPDFYKNTEAYLL